MNITLICFQDYKEDYDGCCENEAHLEILHPETIEEAAVQYQEMLLKTEGTDEERYAITVLIDGREAGDNEHFDELISRVVRAGDDALREARHRQMLAVSGWKESDLAAFIAAAERGPKEEE